MRRTIGIVAVAALVGIVAGVALDSRLRPDSTASPAEENSPGRDDLADIVAEIASLDAALDEERSRRAALELEVTVLRREIAENSAASEAPQAASPGRPETATDYTQTEAEAHDAWFDDDALKANGIDERRAQFLRERFEALQMEELYLRDRATREGWLNTPRYRLEAKQLRENVRETLGDEDFDWLLYASGRTNRVVIHDVLENSPAKAAGIEAGDVILRYDDVVVLTPSDLTSATSRGEPGTSVAVEIQRGGDVQRLYPSRGPLGARITATRRAPLGDR